MPKVENAFVTAWLPQAGQTASTLLEDERTNFSNLVPHWLQRYS